MILPLLPVLIPLATASLSTVFRRSLTAQRGFAVGGSFLHLLSTVVLLWRAQTSGVQVLHVGAWQAPFGISMAVDSASALLLVMTGVLGFAIMVYSIPAIDAERQRQGYFRLLHILLMGVSGAFSTGDLFNLYVWFEVMLIASFVLMVLGNEQAQLEGAVKYVVMNLFSSVLFLIGIGVLYGKTGTLNMADLAVKIAQAPESTLLHMGSMALLIAFFIKAAVFPFFFWLPDSYHVPPVAVTAIFSGLLTKVGVYALLRVATLLLPRDDAMYATLFLVLAGATMVTGVLGAIAQSEMRRLLSFHIVSQIGYVLIALGLMSALAVSGALYFLVHVAIAKAALFLVTGYIERIQGGTELKKLGGLFRAAPLLSLLFVVLAFSLAGFPPLSGFFAKFALVKAALDARSMTIAAVALGVSVLTLFSMTKIWGEAFWKPAPAAGEGSEFRVVAGAERAALLTPIIALALVTVLMGVGAEWVFSITDTAARQLLDPTEYINAMLGAQP